MADDEEEAFELIEIDDNTFEAIGNRGTRFFVYGQKLTAEPVSKHEAEALIARGNNQIH